MSITPVTVSGTYLAQPSVPAKGTVTFELNYEITDGSSMTVPTTPIVCRLDATGSFSVQLFANDDSTTTPQGTLWVVTESIASDPASAPGPAVVTRGYSITLTHTVSSVNLASLAPSVAQIPTFNYITQSAADARYAPISGGGGGGGATLVPTPVKTGNYTAAVNDLARMNATGASRTVTLPSAPADKSQVGVEVVAITSPNVVTITCGGSDVFLASGGATSLSMHAVGDTMILQYTASGATWNIMSFTPFTPADIGALAAANNLSDVGDTGTSRYNLKSVIVEAVCASTSQTTLSGLQIIDSYQTVAGDRVLLAGQTNGVQNGLWVAASGSWARPTDMPAGGSIKNRVCVIGAGTNQTGHFFILATATPIVVDSGVQSWFDDDTTLAVIASSGQLADGQGTIGLAQLPAGTGFDVYYVSGNWVFPGIAGAIQSARPTSRTDLKMSVWGGTAPPSWAIAGDVLELTI